MDIKERNTDKQRSEAEISEVGIFDGILVGIRIISSVGAVCAISYGVVLAVQLFTLFHGIVQDPDSVVVAWQDVMAKERIANAPDAPSDVDEQAGTKPVPEVVESQPVEVPLETESLTPVPETVTNDDTPTESESDSRRKNIPPRADNDAAAFIAFADRTMDRLELGEYSWLIGVGCLAIFCWLLVKIPVMLITLGTQLLLGLVNVSTKP